LLRPAPSDFSSRTFPNSGPATWHALAITVPSVGSDAFQIAPGSGRTRISAATW
jgi:hypothetical protein